ncbi:hypothetical protein HYE67_002527 [Fusarium culmorum]|uniref:Uncharacterized protein n=1 Tax=Fusarium culmorum TaxID=5516 RepID=A0A2T4GVY4_FUSCU|nr:hypothetical protein FCULG_00006765 [Fusarium culmorum]QPC60296.1 hypothetical protein HYE67_002527 [Fusarium culmorum]
MTEESTIVHRTAIFMENVCNRIYCCNIVVNVQQRLCDIGEYYYRTLACFCHPSLSNNAHDDKDQPFKVIYSDLAVMFPLYHVKHQVCDQKEQSIKSCVADQDNNCRICYDIPQVLIS